MHTAQKSLYVVMVPTVTSGPSPYLQTHWLHPDASISIRRLRVGAAAKVLPKCALRDPVSTTGLCCVLLRNLVFILLLNSLVLGLLHYFWGNQTSLSATSFPSEARPHSVSTFIWHLVCFHLDFMTPTARTHFFSILSDPGLCWVWASFSLSHFLRQHQEKIK